MYATAIPNRLSTIYYLGIYVRMYINLKGGKEAILCTYIKAGYYFGQIGGVRMYWAIDRYA